MTRSQHISINQAILQTQSISNYITAVQTLERAELTFVDMQGFFHHTARGDTAGSSQSTHSHTHAHTHCQTHYSITPFLRPSCMCTTESEQRGTTVPTLVFFSFFLSNAHFSHSRWCWNTFSSPSASLPLQLNALNPAFLSLSLSLPLFHPFHSYRACIFN